MNALRLDRRLRGLAAFVIAALSIGGAGCAAITCLCNGVGPRVHVPAYEVAPPVPPGELRAGTARTDITPPPGFPLGGHSIAAGIGRGYWTRLHARAFYFQDREGRSVVLVSCDLFAMPGGLQARVAQSVQDLGLDRDHVILAATHTHQSPGNYLTSRVYNQFASPREGFHRELFEFLAARISRAVREAYADAHADPSGSVRVVIRSGHAPGILRNRAVDSFILNADREAVLAENHDLPSDCASPCERYRAIDDTLTLLEILRKGRADTRERPVGLMVFFSGHPTSMSHETVLYNSDYVGLAMAKLERGSPGRRLVAGFFNGAEGDISPDWKAQNRLDAVKFGEMLRAAVETARLSPGQSLKGDLQIRAMRVDARARVPRLAQGERLADRPVFGAASIGGAEDGKTIFYDLGWKPGARRDFADDQGMKLPAFDLRSQPALNRLLKLTSSLAPPCVFPGEMPVSLVRIDDFAVAALPVEMTRTMWRRIRMGMASRDPGAKWIVPIGLADEYLSYVTTPEEYAAQGYEGASTVFGPWTGPVLQDALEEMAGNLSSPPSSAAGRSRVSAVTYRTGARTHEPFGPAYCGTRYPHPDDGLETLIVDPGGRPNRHWPRFEWTESGTDAFEAQRRSVRLLERAPSGQWRVRLAADGDADDDSGENFLTVLVDGRGENRRWAAIWLAPADASASTEYALSVQPLAAGGAPREPLCSAAFRVEALAREARAGSLLDAPCPPVATPRSD